MTLTGQGIVTAPAGSEIAIAGDGRIGLAIGALLSLSGHSVRLWCDRASPPQECEVRERQAQVGRLRGKTSFALITDNAEAAVKGSDIVIVASPASEYGALASRLGRHLAAGQVIVLADAPLGAGLQFASCIESAKTGVQPNIVETGPLFDHAKIENGVVLIRGPRRKVSVSGLSRNETRRALALLCNLWPGVVPASNLLERGFNDAEKVIIPELRLFRLLAGRRANGTAIGSLSGDAAAVVSAVAGEVQQVARAFSLNAPALWEALSCYGDLPGRAPAELLANLMAMVDWQADDGERAKLAREVADTFVLISSFAMLARLHVPLIDAILELSSCVAGRDLRKQGRTLADLGMLGLDLAEVVELINR